MTSNGKGAPKTGGPLNNSGKFAVLLVMISEKNLSESYDRAPFFN